MSRELKKRVGTGVIGAAALIALIIWGGRLGIFFFATGLSLMMVFEFTEIAYSLPDRIEKRYVMLSLTWFITLASLLLTQSEFALLIFSFFLLFIYFLLTAFKYEEASFIKHFREMAYSVFAIIYLVFLPLYFHRIFDQPHGVLWILVFLFIVWAGDTGAYFVGKKYGKNKLYPKISPKKTWEGAFGGLLASILVTWIFKLICFNQLSSGAAFAIPIIIGIVSQAGDLCESFLKRAFGKKDSGSILPGHGGFLDRFDGVVFSLPVMYACIRVFI